MASSCESSPKNQSPTDAKKERKAAIIYSHVNVLSLGITYTCLFEIKPVIVSYNCSPVSDLMSAFASPNFDPVTASPSRT
jgi:hypothetical protein